MPHSEFFTSNRLLFQSFQGNLAVDMFQDAIPERPAPHGEASVGYDALTDLSEVTNIDGGFTQISAMVSRKETTYRQMIAPTRLAFWAPGDLTFGTCRMFEQIAHDRLSPAIIVTRDLREAIAHIGRAEHTLYDFLIALRQAENISTAPHPNPLLAV